MKDKIKTTVSTTEAIYTAYKRRRALMAIRWAFAHFGYDLSKHSDQDIIDGIIGGERVKPTATPPRHPSRKPGSITRAIGRKPQGKADEWV